MRNLPMIVKFFLAFSLFLVLPLIIAGFIFNYNMVSYSEREIGKSVISNLNTIRKMNDLLVDSISKDTVRLSLNTALEDITGINDYYSVKGNVENVIKLNRVHSILRETYNSNFRLHSVYVYLEDANYILTSGLEGAVLKNEFTDTGWIKEYNENKDNTAGTLWLNGRRIDGGSAGGSRSVITYVLPLKNLSLKLNGAVVVNIKEPELSRLINSTDFNSSGYVSIIDRKGNVISHIDEALVCGNIAERPYIRRIIDAAQDSGYIIDSIDRKKQIVAYNKTEFNGWIYVGVFSLDDLMDKANTLRTRIVSILASIILLGVVLSYFISKKLYHPLNALIQDVKRRKGIDLTDAENEMALLSRAFSTIARQEDDLLDILEKNKVTFAERYLMNLLKGDVENSGFQPPMVVEFPYAYFACAVLSIDKLDRFTEKYPQEQQYYLKMLILKVCEEVVGVSHPCGSVLYDTNKMVVVINASCEDLAQVEKTLKNDFRRVQKEISKVLDNTVTIAVGNYHAGKQGIAPSFNEALEALKKKMIFGYGKIIFREDAETEETRYFYPYTFEKHIFNNLNLGLKEQTLQAVNELVREVRNRTYLSADNILQVFIQLVGNTVKYLVDKNINLSDIFGGDYNVYHKLSAKETLEDVERWLAGFYSGILEYLGKSGKESKDHIDRVFAYISANYRKDIDITAIADYAGISYSYVRKIVKDKTGKSVIDYINGLRVEEAKGLLRQTGMNVMEIALQVGYNNDQSFNRFFKKYEGVTPGEFRNMG